LLAKGRGREATIRRLLRENYELRREHRSLRKMLETTMLLYMQLTRGAEAAKHWTMGGQELEIIRLRKECKKLRVSPQNLVTHNLGQVIGGELVCVEHNQPHVPKNASGAEEVLLHFHNGREILIFIHPDGEVRVEGD